MMMMMMMMMMTGVQLDTSPIARGYRKLFRAIRILMMLMMMMMML